MKRKLTLGQELRKVRCRKLRLRKMETIARLRVQGYSWAQTAEMMGYTNPQSLNAACNGPWRDDWREIYDRAVEMHWNGLEAEAGLKQQSLLRSEDENIAQRAAHSLLAHSAKLRKQFHGITKRVEHGGQIDVGISATNSKGVSLSEYAQWIREHRMNGQATNTNARPQHDRITDDTANTPK